VTADAVLQQIEALSPEETKALFHSLEMSAARLTSNEFVVIPTEALDGAHMAFDAVCGGVRGLLGAVKALDRKIKRHRRPTTKAERDLKILELKQERPERTPSVIAKLPEVVKLNGGSAPTAAAVAMVLKRRRKGH
jgi:hypothetical protein